jgi:UDP-N-acetylglucosamine 4-epimerase
MADLNQSQADLRAAPKTWLITGVAGFIGSNLLEVLLRLDQRVTGLDNFSTGKPQNLEEIKGSVTAAQWARFQLRQADVGDIAACQAACAGVDYVLHEAALGSVPLSVADPIRAHQSNVSGFINMVIAARDAHVKRFVYASSSAIYGDDPGLPKIEDKVGSLLSPYAAMKAINEIYAQTFAISYGLPCVGLRYFNVFGPRQDPEGAYAAVIPKWIAALLKREPVYVNGDGETSRDFCFIADVVQANLLAATTENPSALNEAYNIALGQRTTLNELFHMLQNALRAKYPTLPDQKPIYRDFRSGDVRHSLADISKARKLLGFSPACKIEPGLELAMDWYRQNVV